MKVLLHTCCAPCVIYPYSRLKDQGNEVTAFFYNPNIHPFREFQKRLETLKDYSGKLHFPLIYDKKYDLTDYLRKIVFNEAERCSICYSLRLEETVLLAKERSFDAFTTTLLYSKYQRHDLITSWCNILSLRFNIPFIYEDFREGWHLGVARAKEFGMYRQSYCGCIFSEQERYDKSVKMHASNKNTIKTHEGTHYVHNVGYCHQE